MRTGAGRLYQCRGTRPKQGASCRIALSKQCTCTCTRALENAPDARHPAALFQTNKTNRCTICTILHSTEPVPHLHVHLRQRERILEEAPQVLAALRPHDDAAGAEDGPAPGRDVAIVLQLVPLLQLPAQGRELEVVTIELGKQQLATDSAAVLRLVALLQLPARGGQGERQHAYGWVAKVRHHDWQDVTAGSQGTRAATLLAPLLVTAEGLRVAATTLQQEAHLTGAS